MSERIRAVYATYIQRLQFQLLAVLFFSGIVVLGSLWGAQQILLQDLLLGRTSYLAMAVPVIAIYSALVGEHLKRQLVSPRSHLVPNYRAPHISTALGLSLIFGFLVCIPLAHASPNGFRGIAGSAVLLWSIGLLTFSTGYFLRPLFIVFFFPIGSLTEGTRFWSFVLAVLSGENPALALLFTINSVVTILLFWRMTLFHEQMFEYRSMLAIDNPRLELATDPARQSLRRRIYEWLCVPAEQPLNRIQRPLRPGRLARMQHFQLGFGTGQPFLASILTWTGFMWVANFIIGVSDSQAWYTLMVFLPGFVLVSSATALQKDMLQWLGMLPLTRKELVTALGGAMFGSVVKSWAGCAVAIYFVSWMPQPAFTKALPPLSPFAISLSLQLPLFGVVLLTAKNRQATTRGVAFFAVAVVAMVLSTFSTTGPRVALLIAISILSGTLLIWASYRHWCNADLD